MKGRIVIIAFVMLSLLTACGSGVIFDEKYTYKEALWNSDDIAKFDVPVEDSTELFNFYILIRNTTEYPWANLQLFLKTLFPDNTMAVDTIECFLAAPDGKWLGKGKGFIRDNKILLHRNVRFFQKGLYSFEFKQAMRQDPLPGIESIGLRIEKAN